MSIASAVVWLLGRRSGGFAGRWRATYEHVEQSEDRTETSTPIGELIIVRVLFGHAVGRRVEGGRAGARSLERVRAHVSYDGFVTGVWFDEKDAAAYHGPFQLRLEEGAATARGRWISCDRQTGAWEHGAWVWSREAD